MLSLKSADGNGFIFLSLLSGKFSDKVDLRSRDSFPTGIDLFSLTGDANSCYFF